MAEKLLVDYESKHCRRRFASARRLAFWICLIGFLFTVYWCARPVLIEISRARLQAKCSEYEAKEGTNAFWLLSDTPLPADPTELREPVIGGSGTVAGGARRIKVWEDYCGLLGYQPGPDGVLFLHERQTAAGQKYLIAVTVNSRNMQFPLIQYRTFRIRKPFDSIAAGGGIEEMLSRTFSHAMGNTQLRFWYGSPDASDTSRFKIGFFADGLEGAIVGRLNDDGTVSLSRE